MDNQFGPVSNPRLTRGEYWLLETAVEMKIPLRFLHPKTCSIEELFNKPGHGLNQAQLVATLVELRDAGLIDVSDGSSQRQSPPTEAQVVAAINSGDRGHGSLLYELTQQGAIAWEAFAAPDWNQLIGEEYDIDTAEVTSANRARLETYLDYLGLIYPAFQVQIDGSSARIQELTPWQATYWKTLPKGFSATFCIAWSEGEVRNDKLSWLAFGGACDYRENWYRWR